ncbi:MAG: hypothetical protein EXR95_04680 [Gemmatimonadetes bacterium]|nr:hypothetical protein [Gemmatimonadota bacterium]
MALRLEATTALEQPLRIFFQWSMSDRDARFQGRGVARVEPPYRARLDLFLGNGETVARAALVEDELRLPPGAPEGIIPPAEILWGVLGIFRPGRNSQLLGGEALGEGRVRLRYRLPNGIELRFTVLGGRVEEVERLRQGQTVERVVVTPGDQDRYPLEASYRDLAAFRELKLTRERLEEVEAFPPDIWELAP